MPAILKNKVIVIGIVGVLLVFNYLKWAENDANPAIIKSTAARKNFNFDDLELMTTSTYEKKLKVYRDLFHPAKIKKPTPKKIAKVKPKLKPKGPPPLTPEQIAYNKAKLQLAQIKVMGIMEQNGFQQAFIVYNEDTYIVKKGEKFAEVFQISNISTDRVDIMELKTTLSKTIELNQQAK